MDRITTGDLQDGNGLMKMPTDLQNLPGLSREQIEAHIRRMYLSAAQAAPTEEAMNWIVEDANRLWQGIPIWELPRMIDRAIIESAPYVAICPMVAKCWLESEKKELTLGAVRMSESETVSFVKSLENEEGADPDFVKAFCQATIKGLET